MLTQDLYSSFSSLSSPPLPPFPPTFPTLTLSASLGAPPRSIAASPHLPDWLDYLAAFALGDCQIWTSPGSLPPVWPLHRYLFKPASPSAKCLIFSSGLEQAGGLMAPGSSGFLIVAIQSQLPGYSPHTQVLLGLRTSVCPLCWNTHFLYTLAQFITSLLILPKCHLRDIAAVTLPAVAPSCAPSDLYSH